MEIIAQPPVSFSWTHLNLDWSTLDAVEEISMGKKQANITIQEKLLETLGFLSTAPEVNSISPRPPTQHFLSFGRHTINIRLDSTRLCIPFDCTHLVFPLDYGRLVAPLALPLAFPGRVPAVRCFPRSLSAQRPRSTSDLPPSKFTPTARDPGPSTFLPPHQRRARADTRGGLVCARAITLLPCQPAPAPVNPCAPATPQTAPATSTSDCVLGRRHHLGSRAAGRRCRGAEQAKEGVGGRAGEGEVGGGAGGGARRRREWARRRRDGGASGRMRSESRAQDGWGTRVRREGEGEDGGGEAHDGQDDVAFDVVDTRETEALPPLDIDALLERWRVASELPWGYRAVEGGDPVEVLLEREGPQEWAGREMSCDGFGFRWIDGALRCSSECKIELEDARTQEAINWAMQKESVVMSPASKKERNCPLPPSGPRGVVGKGRQGKVCMLEVQIPEWDADPVVRASVVDVRLGHLPLVRGIPGFEGCRLGRDVEVAVLGQGEVVAAAESEFGSSLALAAHLSARSQDDSPAYIRSRDFHIPAVERCGSPSLVVEIRRPGAPTLTLTPWPSAEATARQSRRAVLPAILLPVFVHLRVLVIAPLPVPFSLRRNVLVYSDEARQQAEGLSIGAGYVGVGPGGGAATSGVQCG
ncbi:hypothetical protein B0H14DRAFT_3146423 [Mycena olivaceomarginata]|nr:hypothetical protein B0H14DRAFT_3146423 [Mycena olivaceomarginata]